LRGGFFPFKTFSALLRVVLLDIYAAGYACFFRALGFFTVGFVGYLFHFLFPPFSPKSRFQETKFSFHWSSFPSGFGLWTLISTGILVLVFLAPRSFS